MGEAKPTLCAMCGNHLLPWTVIVLYDGYYLCRPCPRSDCEFMLAEYIIDNGGFNYWEGE